MSKRLAKFATGLALALGYAGSGGCSPVSGVDSDNCTNESVQQLYTRVTPYSRCVREMGCRGYEDYLREDVFNRVENFEDAVDGMVQLWDIYEELNPELFPALSEIAGEAICAR